MFLLLGFVPLVLVLGTVAAILLGRGKGTQHPTQPAAVTVRRGVVYTLLFILVVLTTCGVALLLTAVVATPLVGAPALAQALTFTVVGAPAAALVFWRVWTSQSDPAERASLAWGRYVGGTATVAMVICLSVLFGGLAIVVGSNGLGNLMTLVLPWAAPWAGTWLLHRAIASDADRGPQAVTDLAPVAGATYGLGAAMYGAVSVLGGLLDESVRRVMATAVLGGSWRASIAAGLIWAVGGAAVWWWHWRRDRVERLSTPLADVAALGLGTLVAAVLAVCGAAIALYPIALRLADPGSTAEWSPLGTGTAMACVGTLTWAYHRRSFARYTPHRAAPARLLTAAVGLATAASGLGIVVNSLLDAATPTLAGAGGKPLLAAGLSALIVGGPTWWLAWRPSADRRETGTAPSPSHDDTGARRVYVVAILGLSALTALVTVLFVAYRLFDSALGQASGEAVIDRIRAPFGLLVATGLVAVYHWSVWRAGRIAPSEQVGQGPEEATQGSRPAAGAAAVQSVLLVTPLGAPAALRDELASLLGAQVSVLARAEAGATPSAESIADSAAAAGSSGVLVVVAPDGTISAIPLAGS